MRKNSIYVGIFTIFLAIYGVLYFALNEAPLYLIGGIIGSLAKAAGLEDEFIYLWISILSTFVIFYYISNKKILNYLIITIIAILLYVTDIIYSVILPSIMHKSTLYLYIGTGIFTKSILLTYIIYFKAVGVKS